MYRHIVIVFIAQERLTVEVPASTNLLKPSPKLALYPEPETEQYEYSAISYCCFTMRYSLD